MARHRLGLSDFVTLGGQGEAAPDRVALGPTFNAALPFGELDLAGAASRGTLGNGGTATVSYGFVSKVFSAGALAIGRTAHYTALDLDADADRPLWEVMLSSGVSLGSHVSVGADWNPSVWRDSGEHQQVGGHVAVSMWSASLTLNVSRSHDRINGDQWSAFAGLAIGLGSHVLSASAADSNGSTSAMLEAQRPLPVGPGWGYDVQAQEAATPRGMGELEYQGDHGRYQVAVSGTPTGGSATATAAGSLVIAGGRFFASRPVQDGFAVLRVPGMPDVHGFVNNQDVGTTDGNGDLFIPNLLPYYGNRLRIDDADLPLETRVAQDEQLIATPYRGAAVVLFDVKRLSTLVGHVVLVEPEGKKSVPRYGDLLLSNGAHSPIGNDGEFYFENVAPGALQATVTSSFGTCVFTLDAPATTSPRTDLGELRCETLGPAPTPRTPEVSPQSHRRVRGRVYSDSNGNHRYDRGEPTFGGVQIGAGQVSTTTDAKGEFTLSGLPEGDATIEVVSQLGEPQHVMAIDPDPTVHLSGDDAVRSIDLRVQDVKEPIEATSLLALDIPGWPRRARVAIATELSVDHGAIEEAENLGRVAAMATALSDFRLVLVASDGSQLVMGSPGQRAALEIQSYLIQELHVPAARIVALTRPDRHTKASAGVRLILVRLRPEVLLANSERHP
jgi:hypothetical protein